MTLTFLAIQKTINHIQHLKHYNTNVGIFVPTKCLSIFLKAWYYAVHIYPIIFIVFDRTGAIVTYTGKRGVVVFLFKPHPTLNSKLTYKLGRTDIYKIYVVRRPFVGTCSILSNNYIYYYVILNIKWSG